MKGRGERGGKTRTCAKTAGNATVARGTACSSPRETPDLPIPFPRQPRHKAQLPPSACWTFVCSPTVHDRGTPSAQGFPTALYGGGRGDLCSRGHRGDLAITLTADEIVLQIHAQTPASPSGCFVQGKGVLGKVAAPRGTHPRRTHPKVLWPNPSGDLSARSGSPPPHGPWPRANPLPLARQHPLPLPPSTGLAKAPTLCWHRILRLNPAA